ncbi:formate dehydrogenase subunit delta [Nocardia sp. R7R-8]|uniref:formate dehydrogenase subunit delta n=1 Tax=Nocardia sp. R7R-8 TaxID=3459304 RepID=UPI00403D75E0
MRTAPAIRLATEIAAQFRHLPPGEAATPIVEHIRRYWEPRLRAQLLEQAAHAGEECDAHVVAVVDLLRSSTP